MKDLVTAYGLAVFGFVAGAALIYRGLVLAFEAIDDGCRLPAPNGDQQ